MTQKVLQIGSSVGVIIPKKSLLEAGLKLGDQIVIEINKRTRSLLIKPQVQTSKQQERIAELTYNFINRYRKDLKALADA